MPIIIRSSDAKYTNGDGAINLARAELKNFPSKKLYRDVYP